MAWKCWFGTSWLHGLYLMVPCCHWLGHTELAGPQGWCCSPAYPTPILQGCHGNTRSGGVQQPPSVVIMGADFFSFLNRAKPSIISLGYWESTSGDIAPSWRALHQLSQLPPESHRGPADTRSSVPRARGRSGAEAAAWLIPLLFNPFCPCPSRHCWRARPGVPRLSGGVWQPQDLCAGLRVVGLQRFPFAGCPLQRAGQTGEKEF